MYVWFRLGVAAFCIVAPTVCYLALWNVLSRLRDDRLIERILEERESSTRGQYPTPWAAFEVSPTRRSGTDSVVCEQCGAPNVDGATYCQACLSRLE